MKRTSGFTADDGTWFATRAECKAHEEWKHLVEILSGLEPFQVAAAMHIEDHDLANDFMRASNIIAKKRRESGDVKRTRKAPAAFENVEKAMGKAAK
jgi:hypothetical protein